MNPLDTIKNIKSGITGAVTGTGDNVVPVEDTKFHRAMDKFNRLPRPVLLILIVSLFIWPIFNPEHFSQWAIAIGIVPDNMWYLIIIIITSWAGTKFMRDIKMPSGNGGTTQINTGTVINTRDFQLDEVKGKNPIEITLEDITNLPPENESIDEWKKKNKK
jgi:hypothetical protein